MLTFHSLNRLDRWRLDTSILFQTLIYPEEVVTGHYQRFIAKRRFKDHLIRAVYEYENSMPVVITVYFPYSGRYFKGGKNYEDKILS